MRKFLLLIYILLLLTVGSLVVYADEGGNKVNEPKKAVLIILDQINIEDLVGEYPNLKSLMEHGVAGLMNVRSAVRYDPASGYLTLGAGTRANVPSGSGQAFEALEIVEGEKAQTIYENVTGEKASPQNILVTDIPKIIVDNNKQNYVIIPGLLGETLKEGDITTILLGNADTPKQKKRYGALIGMDTLGRLPEGVIDESLNLNNPESPFLVKTNYPKLLQTFNEYYGLERNCLLIIQLGDTIRADNYQSYVSPERAEIFRKEALKEADKFIGLLLNDLDLDKDLLMVVTPFPSLAGNREKNLLTPFIMVGPGTNSGLAFSPTTRREGIISNLDIAPTILKFFDLDIPDLMLGYPIKGKSSRETFSTIYEMNQGIKNTNVQRSYIIKPFVALQVIVTLGFLVLFIFRKQWLRFLRPLIIAGMFVPFILLILPVFSSYSLLSKYLWLFLFMVILTLFTLVCFRRTLNVIIFISLVTAIGILLDLACKAPLMKVSVLGYDPIGGSRYYGLGNEYMGVLISSLIIGLTALSDNQKTSKKLITFISGLFLLAFYLIMSPEFGSNVGGTISAFAAFSVIILMFWGIKIRLRLLLYLGLGLLFFLFLLFFVISSQSSPSHISKTVELIYAQGWQSLFLIFGRKIAMNYKLLRYTVWTKALLTSMAVLVALLYKPPYLLKKVFQKHRQLYHGFISSGVGGLFAFIFNDSGIVAAATMMIFTALPILLLVIDVLEAKG
ncbi:MAG: hypothetical protein ACOYJ1_03765 [Peptococcales bacterium]